MTKKIIYLILMMPTLLLYPLISEAQEEYVFERSWPEPPETIFDFTVDVAVDISGNIYATDANKHRVLKLSPDGNVLLSWGTNGHRNGQFNTPQGIAVDNMDMVYVADSHNHRIQKFSPDGDFIAKLGAYGSGPGQLVQPADVAVDGWGYIYVCDSGNNRVQVFNYYVQEQ